MASSIGSSGLGRSRSLRVPASNGLKPVPHNPPAFEGPSHVALFLTNLRLLDLDLRDDWPDITALTFSTKDVQQNQKKRIQCVEWALYSLFALWDPEETQNKLQPFFPPLEHLQSLNLRTALFRCLDNIKKLGVLGRDTVLRKTMLDECKGDRLEEILAVFSNVVLKKVLAEQSELDGSIAKNLALENFSYTGESTLLTVLMIAYKSSLNQHVRDKTAMKARYFDFSELMNLNERRIARRHEQLKELISERKSGDHISYRDIESIQETVRKTWSGSDKWMDTVLYGDLQPGSGLLASPFSKVWNYVESGNIGDMENSDAACLFEQLDARVRQHETRLAKWQAFGKTFKRGGSSSSEKTESLGLQHKKIDLGFTQHATLTLGHTTTAQIEGSATPSWPKYNQIIEDMKVELAKVGRPEIGVTSQGHALTRSIQENGADQFESRPPPKIVSNAQVSDHATEESNLSTEDKEEEWSSVSENDEPSPGFTTYAGKSTSRTPPSEATANFGALESDDLTSEQNKQSTLPKKLPKSEPQHTFRRIFDTENTTAPAPEASKAYKTPTQIVEDPEQVLTEDCEATLADNILKSMATASPSPTKKRHTLSLAERTRLSMSRTSHSKYQDLHDEFETTDLPDLPRKGTRNSLAPIVPGEAEPDRHADLIERTRKSMAGFEAAQKKAQLERRRSIKDEKKKQRQSSYFPKVEEEDNDGTPDVTTTVEILEGDPDYESVFMSRPKIKTSPAVSPSRVWGGRELQD